MKTLMIIDDSPFIAMEIKDIVTAAGYEVVAHARNGEAGIEKFKTFSPDVVTIDIIMPGIDGIETAKEIRKIDPNARIVMLSSLCDDLIFGLYSSSSSCSLSYKLDLPCLILFFLLGIFL